MNSQKKGKLMAPSITSGMTTTEGGGLGPSASKPEAKSKLKVLLIRHLPLIL